MFRSGIRSLVPYAGTKRPPGLRAVFLQALVAMDQAKIQPRRRSDFAQELIDGSRDFGNQPTTDLKKVNSRLKHRSTRNAIQHTMLSGTPLISAECQLPTRAKRPT